MPDPSVLVFRYSTSCNAFIVSPLSYPTVQPFVSKLLRSSRVRMYYQSKVSGFFSMKI